MRNDVCYNVSLTIGILYIMLAPFYTILRCLVHTYLLIPGLAKCLRCSMVLHRCSSCILPVFWFVLYRLTPNGKLGVKHCLDIVLSAIPIMISAVLDTYNAYSVNCCPLLCCPSSDLSYHLAHILCIFV